MNSNTLMLLYNSLSFHKTKDKLAMVLEPLQSMIQLALLSVSMIGTKLTIQDNILYIQQPNIIQPLTRWYHADKKDDLYFLFQVIKRFIKWYNPEHNKDSIVTKELYNLIIKMSIEGLNNLLKTYSSNESNTVIQVINMYKNLLEKPSEHDNDEILSKVNIDEVFIGIMKIYEPTIISIVYNILLLISKEEDSVNIANYIDGFNLLFSKNNKMIKEWIRINLVL